MFLVTSVATLRERTSGTLERLLTMPLGKLRPARRVRAGVRAGGAGAGGVASALAIGLLGLDVAGPAWMLLVVAVLDAVLGIALGLFASAFARSEFQAVQFMPAVVLPQLLLCGLLVPRDQMPDVLQWISNVLPLSYAVDAMTRLSTSVEVSSELVRDLVIIAGVSLVALVLGAATLRRRTACTHRLARGHAARPGSRAHVAPGAPVERKAPVLRRTLLAAAASENVRRLVETVPVSRRVVDRYVAGSGTEDAVRVTGRLTSEGLLVTLDHLGEDTVEVGQAEATRDAYLALLKSLSDTGLASGAEVSVKLSAVGQALPGDGEQIALENARRICDAAQAAGTTVTLDMEDHTTTDSTLADPARPARGLPAVGRGAAGLPAAHRGATAATWPTRGPGSGSARARTRSRIRWRSTPRATSTGPTSAASRC